MIHVLIDPFWGLIDSDGHSERRFEELVIEHLTYARIRVAERLWHHGYEHEDNMSEKMKVFWHKTDRLLHEDVDEDIIEELLIEKLHHIKCPASENQIIKADLRQGKIDLKMTKDERMDIGGDHRRNWFYLVVDLLPDPLYLVDKIFDGDSFLGRLHCILLDPSDLHLVKDRNQ